MTFWTVGVRIPLGMSLENAILRIRQKDNRFNGNYDIEHMDGQQAVLLWEIPNTVMKNKDHFSLDAGNGVRVEIESP
jgi:hypothetical protein